MHLLKGRDCASNALHAIDYPIMITRGVVTMGVFMT